LVETQKKRPASRSTAAGVAIFLLMGFYAFAVLTARPPKDVAFPQGQSPLPAAQARSSEQVCAAAPRPLPASDSLPIAQRLTPPLATGLVLPLGLALLFWATLCWALFKENKLRYLIPGLLFVLFCHFVAGAAMALRLIDAVCNRFAVDGMAESGQKFQDAPAARTVRAWIFSPDRAYTSLLGSLRAECRPHASLFARCPDRGVFEAVRGSGRDDCRNGQ